MRNRFAHGTSELEIGEGMHAYRVCIRYREPEFERRTRPRDQPFRYTFEIHSTTEDAAAALAVREFNEMAKQSSVSWAREIVSVDVFADD